jgi:peptide/nickel transport system permease protein
MGAGAPLSPANLVHPFGTDQLGRDVWSRAVHGAGLVLALSLSGTALGFVLGGALGLVSGYRGGLFDAIAMRLCEALISIPVLVLALLLVALAGVGSTGAAALIVAVIGFVYAPRVARIARAAAMETAQRDFVAAARLRGDGAVRVAFREILPNVSGTLLVEFALRAAYAPVLVASLGFLGFGLKPPTPEWGLMIAENRALIFIAPATVLGPGLLLASLVVGINLLTEGAARVIGRAVPRAE